MTGDHVLDFHQNQQGTLLLPEKCGVSVACYDSKEVQQAIILSIEESLYALALSGMDLRALDGITVALDARKTACELQSLPDGAVPLEMSDQPETMELARTVAVKRGNEFRFHIVMRAGLGLMTLSSKPEEQALVRGEHDEDGTSQAAVDVIGYHPFKNRSLEYPVEPPLIRTPDAQWERCRGAGPGCRPQEADEARTHPGLSYQESE